MQAVNQAIAMFPRMSERLSEVAGSLGGDEQQMLAIARARLVRQACW
jgi:branched-chain amino acid transport system ATP-binding protein